MSKLRKLGWPAAAAFALAGATAFTTWDGALRAARPDSGTTRRLEAAIFEGGYGINWHQKIAAQYTRAHEDDGIVVDLWGEPRLAEKVKPRILRGDPPGIVLESRLPFWLMISTGKLLPFDDELAKPAYGSDRPWRELFIPGTLDAYTSDGSVYAIPTSFGAWGCWYDARQFREHGWSVPKTWPEFEALCDQIQAEGIAPLAFQGKYPYYSWFTYVSLLQRCGGLSLINRVNGLEPGVFSEPDALRAARLLQEMAAKYFQKGAMAMTHTESQLQFVNNKAAMIFCGVWLENEQKDTIPPGFELRCFNVPAVEGGKGNPQMFNGLGMEFIFMPAEGQHSDIAADFTRYLVSPLNAPDMGESIGVISPIRGGTPRSAVSPALQSVLDMMDEASINGAPGIFSCRLDTLLLEWHQQVMVPALGALLEGSITPEEFGKRMDDGITRVHANPDIIIPNFTQYDPAAFGEAT
ncbi:MAG: extracellular solute-binding protein [Candidatus Hydrogenedentes bacterium]|nr:extracellular solute-binding protein [Candidatus Hydrogenedentota bacterium]